MRDVIGQRRLLARLGERAARGDVAHGYELSGPRSIGKHTLAVRLAQTLNCATEPAVPGGCGVCLACRKIERGLHPDVREITRLVDQAKRDDRKNITIEQIREMQRDLALRPLEGHLVKCHFAENIKAGEIQPRKREVIFEAGPQAAAYQPPPV